MRHAVLYKPSAAGDWQQRLHESLVSLDGVRHQITRALRSLEADERQVDSDLMFTVGNHLMILLSSFLKEWQLLERLGKDAYMRQTLLLVEPATERVKRWTGIHRWRSRLLAHPGRDRAGNVVSAKDIAETSDVPASYFEVLLLAHCAAAAVDVVSQRYSVELQLARRKFLLVDDCLPAPRVAGLWETTELEQARVAFNQIADTINDALGCVHTG